MEYAVGVIIATAVGLFASLVGFNKERSFYPVVFFEPTNVSSSSSSPTYGIISGASAFGSNSPTCFTQLIILV
jgi:hypothetical protein